MEHRARLVAAVAVYKGAVRHSELVAVEVDRAAADTGTALQCRVAVGEIAII